MKFVLVDVDGVLNPYGPAVVGYRRQWVLLHGLPHRMSLNPGHGSMLSELADATGSELVWATYWRARANRWIAPRVGLPSLRFVNIPTRARLWSPPGLALWKARHVAAWVGKSTFVWFEDDPEVVRCLAREPNLGNHLLITVDPATGLTERHIMEARAFLDGVDTKGVRS
jgi:hypothetical protein